MPGSGSPGLLTGLSSVRFQGPAVSGFTQTNVPSGSVPADGSDSARGDPVARPGVFSVNPVKGENGVSPLLAVNRDFTTPVREVTSQILGTTSLSRPLAVTQSGELRTTVSYNGGGSGPRTGSSAVYQGGIGDSDTGAGALLSDGNTGDGYSGYSTVGTGLQPAAAISADPTVGNGLQNSVGYKPASVATSPAISGTGTSTASHGVPNASSQSITGSRNLSNDVSSIVSSILSDIPSSVIFNPQSNTVSSTDSITNPNFIPALDSSTPSESSSLPTIGESDSQSPSLAAQLGPTFDADSIRASIESSIARVTGSGEVLRPPPELAELERRGEVFRDGQFLVDGVTISPGGQLTLELLRSPPGSPLSPQEALLSPLEASLSVDGGDFSKDQLEGSFFSPSQFLTATERVGVVSSAEDQSEEAMQYTELTSQDGGQSEATGELPPGGQTGSHARKRRVSWSRWQPGR